MTKQCVQSRSFPRISIKYQESDFDAHGKAQPTAGITSFHATPPESFKTLPASTREAQSRERRDPPLTHLHILREWALFLSHFAFSPRGPVVRR